MPDQRSSRQAIPAQPPQPQQSQPPSASEPAATNSTVRPVRPGSKFLASENIVSGNSEVVDSQPTVITKTPALAQYPLTALHPRDLGRLLEGERLGHFDLIEFVGGGGMGAVFRA